jgi:hypothetical protein
MKKAGAPLDRTRYTPAVCEVRRQGLEPRTR